MKMSRMTPGGKVATWYFYIFMLPVLLVMPFVVAMTWSDIGVVLDSGFAGSSSLAVLGSIGLFIGLSATIPALRVVYYRLPWLLSYVQVLFFDIVIMLGGYEILNYGYQEVDDARHMLFKILMIAWLAVGRIVQCIWFSKNPVEYVGGDA